MKRMTLHRFEGDIASINPKVAKTILRAFLDTFIPSSKLVQLSSLINVAPDLSYVEQKEVIDKVCRRLNYDQDNLLVFNNKHISKPRAAKKPRSLSERYANSDDMRTRGTFFED